MTAPITIKQTALPERGLTVVTVKRADPNRIRPFETFAVNDEGGFVSPRVDFATEAAALQAHDELVRAVTAPQRSKRNSESEESKQCVTQPEWKLNGCSPPATPNSE